MSLKKKSVSLADKISDLLTAAPKPFGSDDESEETKAKVIDFDDEIDNLDDFKNEFNNLLIRKKNVNLLEDVDKRYLGKKVSKKELFNEGGSSEESNDEDVDHSLEESTEENSESDNDEDDLSLKNSENELDAEKNNDNIGPMHEDDEEDSDFEWDFNERIDTSNPLLRDRNSQNGIKTMSAINIRAEIEKANCVREQLRLWENLLEMRIKLQKCLMNSNKMPQYDVYKNYESNSEFKVQSTDIKNKLTDLLNNLIQLQGNLLNNFPETKNILTKGKKRKMNEDERETNDDPMDEEISSDTEYDDKESNEQEDLEESNSKEKKGPMKKKIKLSEFENIIAKNYKTYTDYRNDVIQKWNDKTRIASGIINKSANQTALKQIEFLLMRKDKLLKRTQLKRSEYDIIGKSPSTLEDTNGFRLQEYDSEIYDDDDFYHQILRDLIEYKSTDITDPIQLSKQWIQLQNMRSKLKRKIDTRATKGRRIRYNVHKKLVNFMAPITVSDNWTDHAKDELFSSLFGKIKSTTEGIIPI